MCNWKIMHSFCISGFAEFDYDYIIIIVVIEGISSYLLRNMLRERFFERIETLCEIMDTVNYIVMERAHIVMEHVKTSIEAN